MTATSKIINLGHAKPLQCLSENTVNLLIFLDMHTFDCTNYVIYMLGRASVLLHYTCIAMPSDYDLGITFSFFCQLEKMAFSHLRPKGKWSSVKQVNELCIQL
jgi:hypothetical protein